MNWIAKLGQSIQFVAFAAHCFFAAWLLKQFPQHRFILAGVIVVAAALKEFGYDAKYETDPPQTFTDDLEDFLGYLLGCVIGLL